MPRNDREFSVHAEGLRDLNRALGRISKDLRKDSVRELRTIARHVRGTAQELTRVGETGKLRKGLRYSATAKGAAITSTLPQAPVFEYGGTISPRGVPITIPRDRMVGKAVQRDARNIEEQIGHLLDRIASRNGFH